MIELSEEKFDEIMALLDEATDILTKEIPIDPPDMEVTEWNQTPIGRAVHRISSAIEKLGADE